jgi:Helix-turn-helix domain
MLVAEEAVEIRVLRRQGKSIREIARLLEVSRNTVRRYLRSEGLPCYERGVQPSKLDPYKQYLQERVKAAAPDWIPATVLLRELKALGYPGGYSTLKNHLATLRPGPGSGTTRLSAFARGLRRADHGGHRMSIQHQRAVELCNELRLGGISDGTWWGLQLNSPSKTRLRRHELEVHTHFVHVAKAMNRAVQQGLWDQEDGFYYDLLQLLDGYARRLKVRSMVGLLPLCATTIIEAWQRQLVPQATVQLSYAYGGCPI